MIVPPRQITYEEKKRYIRRKMLRERLKCLILVLIYGCRKAFLISKKRFILVWIDMALYGIRYTMSYKFYYEKKMFFLSKQQKKAIGEEICNNNINKFAKRSYRWYWFKEYDKDRLIQIRYSGKRMERSSKLREKRRIAYKQRYNMGENCLVQYNVDINRAHCLNGKIRIGNNVILAKNVFIDYSGEVEIKDNVQLANGVIIETHHHAFHSDSNQNRKIVIPTSLVIEEGVVVGSRAIIMSSCHYIGKHARVGAGAVVTKDVPDYATVVGVPAKVIKINTSEQVC